MVSRPLTVTTWCDMKKLDIPDFFGAPAVRYSEITSTSLCWNDHGVSVLIKDADGDAQYLDFNVVDGKIHRTI